MLVWSRSRAGELARRLLLRLACLSLHRSDSPRLPGIAAPHVDVEAHVDPILHEVPRPTRGDEVTAGYIDLTNFSTDFH
jgi:hypothetical protein